MGRRMGWCLSGTSTWGGGDLVGSVVLRWGHDGGNEAEHLLVALSWRPCDRLLFRSWSTGQVQSDVATPRLESLEVPHLMVLLLMIQGDMHPPNCMAATGDACQRHRG